MNIKEIVKKYLDDNGYDGLYGGEECACSKDNLFECGSPYPDCQAGYVRPAPEDSGCDFFIGPEKQINLTEKYTATASIEQLWHYKCGHCSHWFTVGDPPAILTKQIVCRKCRTILDVKVIGS